MANILKSHITFTPPETENLIILIKNGLRRNSEQFIFNSGITGNRWTGREVELAVTRVSKYLLEECNFKKGDVCSIFSEENDYVVILTLAIACVGGASNVILNSYTDDSLLETASVLKSKFLISSHDLLLKLKNEIEDLESKLCVITYDKSSLNLNSCWKTISEHISKDSSEEGISLDELCERISIDVETDFAVFQFSSGTTGKPKPIPRTHKNLCHLVASVSNEELVDLKPGVVLAGSFALTHRPGLWAILACVVHGSEFVIWTDCISSAENALKTIEKYKVNIFALSVPFMAIMASQAVKIKDNYDLSSLEQLTVNGAKVVNANMPEILVREFNLKIFRQCFGMTESGWVFLIEKSNSMNNYLTVGHVVPGMEAIVIDRDTLEPLQANTSGEVALRGPQIFPGYLTSQEGILNRSDFTEHGWFRTGDKGYYDDNELVHIEGRYKELMILHNNRRFFPTEIETTISRHPAVEAVCVVKISKSSDDFYDIARAFVSVRQGFSLSEAELLDFIKEKDSFIILEGGVRIIGNFPRLQNGKFDRQTLSKID